MNNSYRHVKLNDPDQILHNNFKFKRIKGLARECDIIICQGRISIERDYKISNDSCSIFIALKNKLDDLQLLRERVLSKLSHTKIALILSCTDATWPLQTDLRFKKPPKDFLDIFYGLVDYQNIKTIYVANLDRELDGYNPLPIGLATEFTNKPTSFSWYKKYDKSSTILERPITMTVFNRLYSKQGQWADRLHVSKLADEEWNGFCHNYNKVVSHSVFLLEMTKYPFTICTHGGGIDPCPKLWEALLCGTIPIVKRYPSLEEAYQGLPIVTIEEWDVDAITPELLKIWLDKYAEYFLTKELRIGVLERLSMRYWLDKITHTIAKVV